MRLKSWMVGWSFEWWGMVGLPRKYGGWHRCPLTRNLWPNSQWGARGSTERGERGQIGYQIGWNLKVSLSGKREASGQIGVLQFYIQRICTRTVEGLEPKIHYLPTKLLLFNLPSLLPERQSVTKQLWIWTLLIGRGPKRNNEKSVEQCDFSCLYT